MDRRQEFQLKHQRVASYLRDATLDAALLARRCNFSWLTCGAHNYVGQTCDVGNSFLLIDADGATVIANNIEAPRLAGEELSDLPIDVVDFPYDDPEGLRRAIADRSAGGVVATDAAVAGLAPASLGNDFDRLRWHLTEAELDRYRRLCSDVVVAVESACRGAKVGASELTLAGQVALTLGRVGCVPWVLLVGADDRLQRFRHPLPTTKAIERTVMVAVCAERDGLISACSRVVSFGPVSDDLALKHQACATVDAALWSRTQPGTPLGEIFAEAIEAYQAVGFADQWRHHHQGGSIGYLPREIKAAPNEPICALADQAFAWNPSITGTKSEDTILCTGAGPVCLAEPTDWPTLTADWKGFQADRPDILVR